MVDGRDGRLQSRDLCAHVLERAACRGVVRYCERSPVLRRFAPCVSEALREPRYAVAARAPLAADSAESWS